MDTKLKSRHRLGILLCVITLALASLVTVAGYPWMAGKAQAYRQIVNQSIEESDQAESEIAVQIMNSIYQAWREKSQKEEGHFMTPSQVFLPGVEERIKELRGSRPEGGAGEAAENGETWEYGLDFYEELQNTMDSVGQEWQEYAGAYSQKLPYVMLDQEGNLLGGSTGGEDPAAWAVKELQGQQARVRLRFDASGGMEIISLEGPEKVKNALGTFLAGYQFYDPMEKRLSYDYRYSGVEFSGPKNVEFVYQCAPADFGDAVYSGIRETAALTDFVGSGAYHTLTLAVCAFVVLAAFLLPAFRSLELGKGRFSRLNLEPACILGFFWALFWAGAAPVAVYFSSQGLLGQEFAAAGLAPWAEKAAEGALNLIFWLAVYGSLFWLALCVGAVFRLGLWRYLRERTWTARLFRFVKQWVVRCLNPFNEVDWHERSTKAIGKAVIANFIIVAAISLLWFLGIGVLVVYSIVLFFLLKKYWGQMEKKYDRLLDAINQMAEGNLDVEIEENLGLFEPLKEQLLWVRRGFKKAVDQEVKSERTKTELITNVSHDLKTPLTAIITYINLLKQPELTEEERKAYIQVLDQKSLRLKVLIEDLFEVSKANNGAVNLHLEPVDLASLIKQVRLELAESIDSCGVDFRWNLPQEKVEAMLDGQRTCRIFENLLVNITKYAMPGTRAYVELKKEGDMAVAILRNISAAELTVSPEELTERFVRGDESRGTVEGSGLGLAIARSFTELQAGKMEVSVEGDLFRVMLKWKLLKKKDEDEGRTAPPQDGEAKKVPEPGAGAQEPESAGKERETEEKEPGDKGWIERLKEAGRREKGDEI